MYFAIVIQLQYSFEYDNWNSFKSWSKNRRTAAKMFIRRFSAVFITATIKNIGGCFQSVREAAVCRIFAKYLGKQRWLSPFKVKLCENSKNRYFTKRSLRVSLPFGLRVNFIFFKDKDRSELVWGKSCEELK